MKLTASLLILIACAGCSTQTASVAPPVPLPPTPAGALISVVQHSLIAPPSTNPPPPIMLEPATNEVWITANEPAAIYTSSDLTNWVMIGMATNEDEDEEEVNLLTTNTMAFFRGTVASEQILFTWNASSDPTVIGYNLWFGTNSGVYSSEIGLTNETAAWVTIPNPAPTNYFVLQATDGKNESPFSNEATYSPPPLTLRITNETQ